MRIEEILLSGVDSRRVKIGRDVYQKDDCGCFASFDESRVSEFGPRDTVLAFAIAAEIFVYLEGHAGTNSDTNDVYQKMALIMD